ncbi:MAG: PH domain-containing protein [Nocardioidaceae bacterium]
MTGQRVVEQHAVEQEAPFRRVHPVTPLLRGGIFLLAWLGWLVNRSFDGDLARWEVAISGGVTVLAGLVLGAASWWFTRFRISSDEIRVDSGFIMRKSRRVRIERLQAVEVQQPVMARLLGMAELKLEVAGSDGSVKLAFLPLAQATALRQEVLARKGTGTAGTAPDAEQQPEVPLFAVDTGRLAASLVLRTGFVATLGFAVLGVVVGAATGTPLGMPVVLGAALAVGSFWVRQMLSWGRFTIAGTGQGLRIRNGLLSLRSQTVPLGRVQGLVVVEPILWRLFGWARMDVTVAGVGGRPDDEAQQIESALVPVATKAEVLALMRRVHGVDLAALPMLRPPRRAGWVDPIGRHYAAVGVDDWVVVTRRGMLTTRTDVVPRAKIQSVSLRQGPLERRLGLASTQVHVPSGPVAALALHRDQADAWWLTHSLARPR